MKALRDHQVRAIDILRASLRAGNRRPIIASPTGSGKTVIASAIIRMAREKGNRVLFVAPALSLIDQTVEAFWSEGIRDVGVLQGNHPLTNRNMPVQVASVQTLIRRKLPSAQLVIIDEAHRRFEFVSKWMQEVEWRRVPFVGLSATPWTRGLGLDYDDLIIPTTTAELIEQGYLAPFRIFAPTHPDLSQVRTVAGDYHEGDLSGVMGKPKLVADAVTTWRERGEGRPTLCFAVDRAHARKLQEQFTKAGVSAEYADALTSREERTAIGKRLESGQTQVVCNVGIFTTGVDWPFVSCLSFCRPTKSEMLAMQIWGRALRTHPRKADALIFDHTDTALRLGLPTDIHHDELDDGKPRTSAAKKREQREPALPKECAACGVLKPAGVHKCPACGFAPQKQSTLSFDDGTLSELTAGSAKFTREDRQQWYSMLRGVALERGYKDGWVAHAYRSKIGVWPRGLADKPLEPSAEVRGYVRHLMIRHAKAREPRALARMSA